MGLWGSGRQTVKTASEIVPMINASELLYLSRKGGLVPCCVSDASHFGRAIDVDYACVMEDYMKKRKCKNRSEEEEGERIYGKDGEGKCDVV